MHRLSSSFILGYHGCDRKVGERLLKGAAFRLSDNDYDWLGPGVYFWEANPVRGLEFAREASERKGSSIRKPFVIGAVIDLGLCLDMTTSTALEWVQVAYEDLQEANRLSGLALPKNSEDLLKRNLDCAVIRRLHAILGAQHRPAADTVKGIFMEGASLYPGSGFREKTHVQIAVRNTQCIKGVFRVSPELLTS